MSKKRLNITLDPDVVERARRYSRDHNTSISRLVGEFLARLPVDDDSEKPSLSPTVRRLVGVAKGGPNEEDYRRYLLEKYGS